MTIQDQRIIFKDNAVENDLSVELNNYTSDTAALPIVAAEDYLYVASALPFNHRWFEVSTANSQASAVSVAVWDGKDWNDVVDVTDRTASGGLSMAQSGLIEFIPNREKTWQQETDSEDVDGIAKVGLYQFYWVRFSWDGDFSASTALKYVGFKFVSDSKMYTVYPDLDRANLRNSFATGKTDWNQQHFIAAEEIIDDLQKRRLVLSPNQILAHENFELAAVHKAAEIIYRGLGRAYSDDRDAANKYYIAALESGMRDFDLNRDGRLSPSERGITTGFMSR